MFVKPLFVFIFKELFTVEAEAVWKLVHSSVYARRRDVSLANAAPTVSRGVRAPRQLTALPALSLDLFLSNSHSLFTFVCVFFFFLHCLFSSVQYRPPKPSGD